MIKRFFAKLLGLDWRTVEESRKFFEAPQVLKINTEELARQIAEKIRDEKEREWTLPYQLPPNSKDEPRYYQRFIENRIPVSRAFLDAINETDDQAINRLLDEIWEERQKKKTRITRTRKKRKK